MSETKPFLFFGGWKSDFIHAALWGNTGINTKPLFPGCGEDLSSESILY